MKNKLSIIDRFKDLLTINKTSLEDKINLQFINSLLKEYPTNSLNTFSSADENVQYDIIHKITTFSDNIILKHPECLFYLNRYLRHKFSNMRTFLDKSLPVYKQNEFINKKYAYFIELLYNNESLESLKTHINECPHFIHIFNEINNLNVKKFCCDIHLSNAKKENIPYLDLLDKYHPDLKLYSNEIFIDIYLKAALTSDIYISLFKNPSLFKYTFSNLNKKSDTYSSVSIFIKMVNLHKNHIINDAEFKENIILAKPYIENNQSFFKFICNSFFQHFQHISLSGLTILYEVSPNLYNLIKKINNIEVYKEHMYWNSSEDIFKYFIKQDHINNQTTTKNIANVFILNGNDNHLSFIYNIFQNDEKFIKYLTSLFIHSEEYCNNISKTAKENISHNIQYMIPFIQNALDKIKNEEIILDFLISFNELNTAFSSSKLDLDNNKYYKNSDSIIYWIFSTCCKTVFSFNLSHFTVFNKIQETQAFENLLFRYVTINKPDFLSDIDFQNTHLKMEDIYNLFQNKLLQQTFNIEEKKNKIKRL